MAKSEKELTWKPISSDKDIEVSAFQLGGKTSPSGVLIKVTENKQNNIIHIPGAKVVFENNEFAVKET